MKKQGLNLWDNFKGKTIRKVVSLDGTVLFIFTDGTFAELFVTCGYEGETYIALSDTTDILSYPYSEVKCIVSREEVRQFWEKKKEQEELADRALYEELKERFK